MNGFRWQRISNFPFAIVLVAGSASGCNSLIGLDLPKDRIDAGTAVAGTGGMGGTGGFGGMGGIGGMGGDVTNSTGMGGSVTGTGGSGGGASCTPGGPCMTGLLGVCAIGSLACDPNPTCNQTQVPSVEKCDTADDENCDGYGCVGNHLWSKRFGDALGEKGEKVAIDSQGNVVLAGQFQGTINFGGATLTSAGDDDIYVAKFDSTGQFLWNRQFGDANWQGAWALVIDAQDNIFIAGSIAGTVSFGSTQLVTAADDMGDIFVAKLDKAGAPLWAKHAPGAAYQGIFDMAVDGAGNVLMVGEIYGTCNFGGSFTSAGSADIFVAKVDGNGNNVWTKVFGGSTYQGAYGVATDKQGNVFFIGYSDGDVNFGGGVRTHKGQGDAVLVKLDSSGGHVWSNLLGDEKSQSGIRVAADSGGNVIAALTNWGTIDFGGPTLTSGVNGDVGVVKLGPTGTYMWSKRFFNSAMAVYDPFVTVDAVDDVILAGAFEGSMDFGGGTIVAVAKDLYALKLGSSGNHIWSKRFGVNGNKVVKDIATGPFGDLFVTGHFDGVVDFGGGALSGAGNNDVFLAHFGP